MRDPTDVPTMATPRKDKDRKSDENPTIAQNKRARYEYFIEEKLEAGLVLQGWEVKSLRAGKAQITEGYVLIKDGEAFLIGAHITPLRTVSTHIVADPTRTRKLLLNRSELDSLVGAVERKGHTVVPLELYWKTGQREARDRPRQGQAGARQARHREGPRLAAREVAPAARKGVGVGDSRKPLRGASFRLSPIPYPPIPLYSPPCPYTGGVHGGDRFRRGSRNSRCMPRCKIPR